MSELVQDAVPRTRRALLTAAAGAAAAAAATIVAPAAALAADPNDVVGNQDNATTAVTSITQGTADTGAFEANGKGTGPGVVGTTGSTKNAGVIGLAGDASGSSYGAPFDLDSGVYGYANQSDFSSGVYAEGPTGVYSYGDVAVYADGGTVGVFATAYPQGAAVHAHAGNGQPPASTTNVALLGTVTTKNQAGVLAYGRAMFPDRSGRTTFNRGQASKTLNISGVTSSNYALAVLNASRSGVYVRAVVPGSGKITIYLNKAPSSRTSVAWLVLG